MLATLQEEDTNGQRLLDAARGLVGAFSDLLRAAEPETVEVSFGYEWMPTISHFLPAFAAEKQNYTGIVEMYTVLEEYVLYRHCATTLA